MVHNDLYSTEKIKIFTTRLLDLSQKEFDKRIFGRCVAWLRPPLPQV